MSLNGGEKEMSSHPEDRFWVAREVRTLSNLKRIKEAKMRIQRTSLGKDAI